MTPAQARDAADRKNGDIASGKDPAAEKRAKRLEMSVEDLFQDWLVRHAKIHKKSWRRDEENFKLHFADLKHQRISQVRRVNVTTWHAKLGGEGGSGPYLANRMLSLLSALFNWADVQHDFPGKNPCRGVKRFKELSRERFLQSNELPKFFSALKTEPSDLMRDYFWLLLLTGARRNNVAAMRWNELNLDSQFWAIPDTKSGFPVTIPLSDQAVKILKDRQERTATAITTAQEDGEIEKAMRLATWVFPSYGSSQHLTEPKKAWAALLERAGLSDLHIHDLRRTLGSWQAITGASLPVIGKSLGHKNQATTMIYARLNHGPVRDAVGTATAAMLALIAPKKKGTHKPTTQ